jgi:hypothetical protein
VTPIGAVRGPGGHAMALRGGQRVATRPIEWSTVDALLSFACPKARPKSCAPRAHLPLEFACVSNACVVTLTHSCTPAERPEGWKGFSDDHTLRICYRWSSLCSFSHAPCSCAAWFVASVLILTRRFVELISPLVISLLGTHHVACMHVRAGHCFDPAFNEEATTKVRTPLVDEFTHCMPALRLGFCCFASRLGLGCAPVDTEM